jgi:hypothetical protein
MRYAISCTPGGLIKDDRSGRVITFASYADAEADAFRLSQEASGTSARGSDFTPVPLPDGNGCLGMPLIDYGHERDRQSSAG